MKIKSFHTFIASFAILIIIIIACTKQVPKPVVLNILAGQSLKNPLEEIKNLYTEQEPHVSITYNFGNTGIIQKEIERGANVDIFITGTNTSMDYLQSKGFLLAETRQNLVSSQIVVIVPKDISGIASFLDLANNKIKKIAVSDAKVGSSGKHALEIFTYLKILNRVKSKFVLTTSSVEVVSLVANRRVDAGILFATDALQSNLVKAVAIAPESSHSPIFWPMAVMKNSKNISEAKEFVKFLKSELANSIFIKYGFIIVVDKID